MTKTLFEILEEEKKGVRLEKRVPYPRPVSMLTHEYGPANAIKDLLQNHVDEALLHGKTASVQEAEPGHWVMRDTGEGFDHKFLRLLSSSKGGEGSDSSGEEVCVIGSYGTGMKRADLRLITEGVGIVHVSRDWVARSVTVFDTEQD